jgi:hypothetical protein
VSSSEDNCLPLIVVAPRHNDLGTFVGEGDGGSATDAGESAGDQNNLRTQSATPLWAPEGRWRFVGAILSLSVIPAIAT